MLYNPTQNLYSGNVTRQAGLTYYDSREDTLEIIHADGAATYTGQDNYIRVYNNYGANLTKGTFVQFSGAIDDVATCTPFVNNANAQGLYSIGVLATNTEANTIGRAKLLGEIRNINTTGNTVGETWQLGDILWANPGQPGTLTKVKPTAPNIALSVAAVLKSDAYQGILLVRPTIWPRLSYATFSDTSNQTHANVNYGRPILFNTTDISSGFTKSLSNNAIISSVSGRYNILYNIQLNSTNSSSKNVYVWGRKNGQDLPNSTIVKTISGTSFDVLVGDFIVSMNAGDSFQIMWAVSDTNATVVSPTNLAFAPNIPSVIVTVIEIAL